MLSEGLSDHLNSFYRQTFHVLMAEELLLLSQENSCHIQLKTTCVPWHISAVCLQN